GGDAGARARLAADRERARHRVSLRRGSRVFPRRGPGRRRAAREVRPRLDPRAGREGSRGVRPPGAQPGAHGARRRQAHGLLRRVRLPVRAGRARAAQRDLQRLREPRPAVAVVSAARFAGRDDLRARRQAARLPPPRHGLRADDALRQAVHGLRDIGPECDRHDRDGRDPVREAIARPGCPVVFGSFLSNTDMQSGSPSFGTPESAVGLLCTGQIARHYNLPFRGGGALTSSQVVDAQAGYESMMSLWPTFLAGTNFVMHSAGWLESALVSCYEKFVTDIESLRLLYEVFKPLEVNEETLAYSAHQ